MNEVLVNISKVLDVRLRKRIVNVGADIRPKYYGMRVSGDAMVC